MSNEESSPNHSNLDYPINVIGDASEEDPFCLLKKLMLKNSHQVVIGQININSIRNKFELFKKLVKGILDIVVVTESKLDESFPQQQFLMEGYNLPFRADRNGIEYC